MAFPLISETIRAFASHLASREEITYSFIDNMYLALAYPNPLIKALALTIASALSCWALTLLPIGKRFKRNYSHVDRLWSILPVLYVWIYFSYQVYFTTGSGSATLLQNLGTRTFATTALVTLWGIRLSFNAYRKGYYNLDYEDYRWIIVRNLIKNPIIWEIFSFFFISCFQIFLLFTITWPVYYIYLQEQQLIFTLPKPTPAPFKMVDYAFIGALLIFLVGETIADQQQWEFQQAKNEYARLEAENQQAASEGRSMEPLPFTQKQVDRIKVGFIHWGLWRYSRHPNFFCEQAFWVTLSVYSYLNGVYVTDFSSKNLSLFQYTLGAFILVLLFAESTTLTESISETKYPLYTEYLEKTSVAIPWFSKVDFTNKEKQS